MFEDECHLIDIKLAGELALKNNIIGKADFDKYVNMHIQSNLVKSVIEDCDNKIALLQDTISVKVLCEPDKTEEIRNIYTPRIVYYDLIKNDKIKELSSLNEANVLDKTSGPCIQQLDEVLKANKVERQGYHGKCFVGNHVHIMLKPQPLLGLCNSIPKLISNLGFIGTNIHLLSVKVSQNFKQLFQYYSKCHKLMNSSQSFQENDIQELDLAIRTLMEYYRLTWPSASVTPKMHLLESHVIQFIQKWGLGIGVYGEQGGEGLLAEFNNLNRLFWHMKGCSRLKSTLKEQYLRNHPKAKAMKPEIKKEKKLLRS